MRGYLMGVLVCKGILLFGSLFLYSKGPPPLCDDYEGLFLSQSNEHWNGMV